MSMQRQVRAYLRHADEQMETMHDIDAIQSLSPTLQRELAFCIMEKTVNQFKFFIVFSHFLAIVWICLIGQNFESKFARIFSNDQTWTFNRLEFQVVGCRIKIWRDLKEFVRKFLAA